MGAGGASSEQEWGPGVSQPQNLILRSVEVGLLRCLRPHHPWSWQPSFSSQGRAVISRDHTNTGGRVEWEGQTKENTFITPERKQMRSAVLKWRVAACSALLTNNWAAILEPWHSFPFLSGILSFTKSWWP